MSGKNNKFIQGRRDMLSQIGITLGATIASHPIQLLFETILNGMISKAHAQAANPRRYLFIQHFGAPPRWTFDLFLTPYNTSNFVANAQVGTKYVLSGGRATSVTYATVLAKGINVPYMWQFPVPRAGGGDRPMTDLLNNLLHIRGVTTANAGHGGSAALRYRPLGAVKSVPALSGDASANPFPAVNLSATEFRYLSTKGKAAINLGNSGNMIQSLLTPFMGTLPAGYKANKQKVQTAINAALDEIEQYAIDRHPGADIISQSREGAETLLNEGFGDLTDTWNSLLAKYRDLISRAIDPTRIFTGINNAPIGLTGNRTLTHRLSSITNILTTPDIRNLITANTTITRMAEHFAVAEYVLVNDLSSSMAILPGGLTNLSLSGNTSATPTFDEHYTGAIPSLYLNTMYYRAYASCLLELIDRLKAENIWNDTVIDTAGEFNRSARGAGTGSDHGFQGASAAIYSGAIAGPIVLGNIKKETGATSAAPGTWGYGAPVAGQSSGQLTLGHIAATLAYLLRTQSPITAYSKIIGTDGTGKIVPTIELAKQV